MAILLSIFVIAINLVRGFRSFLITVTIIIILMINKKVRIKNKSIIMVGVLLFIIIVLFGALRGKQSIFDTIILTLCNGTTNIKHIMNGIPKNIDFQHGYSYLVNFIMLMPGPNEDFTLWLKHLLNLRFDGGGITPTIVGEFYLNFGYIGVAIGMLVIGYLSKVLQEFYKKTEQLYLSSFLIVTFLNTIRGGIGNVEITLLIKLIVYYICIFFASDKGIEFCKKIKIRNS